MGWSAACAEQKQKINKKLKNEKNWWLWNYDVLLMSYCLNWNQLELVPEPFYFGRVGAGAAENRAAPQLCDGVIDLLIPRMIEWLTDWTTHRLIDWFIDQPTNWLNDQLTGW